MNKLNILIVDDAYSMRELIARILEEAGHHVVGEAKDGLEAIQMYAKLTPDLVTMDINMPQMDGLEATRKIIKDFPSANILIISDDNSKKEEALNAGAIDFLRKPFQPAFLWSKIDNLIEGKTFVISKNDDKKTEVVKRNDFIKQTDKKDDLLSFNVNKTPDTKNRTIVKKMDEIEFEIAGKPNEGDIFTIEANTDKSYDGNVFVFPKDFDDKYQSENKLSKKNSIKKQQAIVKKYNEVNENEEEVTMKKQPTQELKAEEPIERIEETSHDISEEESNDEGVIMVSISPPRGMPTTNAHNEPNKEGLKEVIINPNHSMDEDGGLKKKTSLLDKIKNKFNFK